MYKRKLSSKKYWREVDFEGDCVEPLPPKPGPNKLVQGIDLGDLCNGKDIIIEFAPQTENNLEKDELDDDIFMDPKVLQEKRGAPPLTCKFEELSQKMTNITEDGFVKKLIIKNGIGKVVPDKSYVTIHYNLYKENSEVPFDSTFLRKRPVKFRLGQGETIVGLDYAVRSMKTKENSQFLIKWEVAYGALGCPDRIEPMCDIVADVTLLSFVEIENDVELAPLTQEELDKADFRKSMNQVKTMIIRASEEFSKRKLSGAVVVYKKALKLLNDLRLANEEQEKEFLEKKVKVLVNLAVCYNKLGKPEQACVSCQEALSINRNSIKAIFHYGKAQLALSNFKLAEEYLTRAYKLKPEDIDINKELRKLNSKKGAQLLADKFFWKKVFNEEGKTTRAEGVEQSPVEDKLKKSLEDCFKKETSYILQGPLAEEERQICSTLASAMTLNFEKKENDFVLSTKQEGTSKVES